MALAFKNTNTHLRYRFSKRFCNMMNIIGNRSINVDCIASLRACCNFLHIRIRGKKQSATWGNSNGAESVCCIGSTQICAFKRVNRNVYLFATTPKLFTNEKHRSFIALAFSDNNPPRKVHSIKCITHSSSGCLICRNFIAAPVKGSGCNSGFFSNFYDFKNAS